MVSDKKIFSCFPTSAYVKHVTPGRGHFRPQGHNLNKLGRGPLGDAHIKYQGFRTYGFREEDFHVFPISAYVNNVTPGAGPVLAPGA